MPTTKQNAPASVLGEPLGMVQWAAQGAVVPERTRGALGAWQAVQARQEDRQTHRLNREARQSLLNIRVHATLDRCAWVFGRVSRADCHEGTPCRDAARREHTLVFPANDSATFRCIMTLKELNVCPAVPYTIDCPIDTLGYGLPKPMKLMRPD